MLVLTKLSINFPSINSSSFFAQHFATFFFVSFTECDQKKNWHMKKFWCFDTGNQYIFFLKIEHFFCYCICLIDHFSTLVNKKKKLLIPKKNSLKKVVFLAKYCQLSDSIWEQKNSYNTIANNLFPSEDLEYRIQLCQIFFAPFIICN